MIGQRCRCRKGVLDRRKLGNFVARPRTITLIEVVAEERLVVNLVEGVVGLRLGLGLGLGLLLRLACDFGCGAFFGPVRRSLLRF